MTSTNAERLAKYYTHPQERDIGGGLLIKIAPLPHDVPEMESFQAEDGQLVINFRTADEKTDVLFQDPMLEIHAGASTGRLARIVVKGDVNRVMLEVQERLGRVRSTLFQRVQAIHDVRQKLAEAGRADLIDRQLNESEEWMLHAARP